MCLGEWIYNLIRSAESQEGKVLRQEQIVKPLLQYASSAFQLSQMHKGIWKLHGAWENWR